MQVSSALGDAHSESIPERTIAVAIGLSFAGDESMKGGVVVMVGGRESAVVLMYGKV